MSPIWSDVEVLATRWWHHWETINPFRDSNCELSRDGVYMPPHLLSCSGDEVVGFPLAFTLTVINCLTPSPKAMGPPDHKLNPLKP